MIRIFVEVNGGAFRLEVAVQAGSISEALNVVKDRYPAGDIRVRFPIDGEEFFVREDDGSSLMELEASKVAG